MTRVVPDITFFYCQKKYIRRKRIRKMKINGVDFRPTFEKFNVS